MKSLKILSVLALIGGAALTARADAAFQASLWAPDIQLVPATDSVSGVRLEIYGENKNMTGLDLGFANVTTGDFTGVSGIIIPAIFNKVDGTTKGVQFGIVNLTKGAVTGWQAGLVNLPESAVTGLQTAAVNWNDQGNVDFTGLQIGFVNAAKNVTGVQLGFVNYAETLKGVQIGLWNQVNSRDWDEFKPLPKVFPFINLGF